MLLVLHVYPMCKKYVSFFCSEFYCRYNNIFISVLQTHRGMERAHDGGDLPYEEPWQGMALVVSGFCCVYGENPAKKKYWGPLMIGTTPLR